MKALLALIMAVFLAGCNITPVEPSEVIVREVEYIKGVSPDIPSRPDPITKPVKEPTLYTITPEVMAVFYGDSIKQSGLSETAQKRLLEDLKRITKVAHEQQSFAFIAVSKEEYFNQARVLQELVRWMKQANARFDYVDSLKLTVLPDESSGKD